MSKTDIDLLIRFVWVFNSRISIASLELQQKANHACRCIFLK